VHEDVTLGVQRTEQVLHERKDLLQVTSLFVLRVGALGDLDIEPEAGKALIAKRTASDEPTLGGHQGDCDGRHFLRLPEEARGALDKTARNLVGQICVGRARESYMEEGHDKSPFLLAIVVAPGHVLNQ
jgi:hypothetical protein